MILEATGGFEGPQAIITSPAKLEYRCFVNKQLQLIQVLLECKQRATEYRSQAIRNLGHSVKIKKFFCHSDLYVKSILANLNYLKLPLLQFLRL